MRCHLFTWSTCLVSLFDMAFIIILAVAHSKVQHNTPTISSSWTNTVLHSTPTMIIMTVLHLVHMIWQWVADMFIVVRIHRVMVIVAWIGGEIMVLVLWVMMVMTSGLTRGWDLVVNLCTIPYVVLIAVRLAYVCCFRLPRVDTAERYHEQAQARTMSVVQVTVKEWPPDGSTTSTEHWNPFSQATCSICIEDLHEPAGNELIVCPTAIVMLQPCRHIFHSDCYTRWVISRPNDTYVHTETCCICKHVVDSRDLMVPRGCASTCPASLNAYPQTTP
jgi:hypothetical protein